MKIALLPILLGMLLVPAILRSQELDAAARTLKFREGDGKAVKTHLGEKVSVKGNTLVDANGKELAKLTKSEDETVRCHAFNSNGSMVAIGICYDSYMNKKDGTIRGYIRTYECASGRLLRDSGAPVIGPVERIAFSDDGAEVLYRSGKVEFIGGK